MILTLAFVIGTTLAALALAFATSLLIAHLPHRHQRRIRVIRAPGHCSRTIV